MKKTTKTNSRFIEEREYKRLYIFKNHSNTSAIKSVKFQKHAQWNKDYKEKHICKYPSDVLDYRTIFMDILSGSIDKNLLDKAEKNCFKCSSDETIGTPKKYSEVAL